MVLHVFNVAMSCEGCSGAVTRVLNKLGADVQNVSIDMTAQKVTVDSGLTTEALLAVIKKTGKECSIADQ